MKRALQNLIYQRMIKGELHLYQKKIKYKQMKRAITNFDTQ